jgi:hypothetical protein
MLILYKYPDDRKMYEFHRDQDCGNYARTLSQVQKIEVNVKIYVKVKYPYARHLE